MYRPILILLLCCLCIGCIITRQKKPVEDRRKEILGILEKNNMITSDDTLIRSKSFSNPEYGCLPPLSGVKAIRGIPNTRMAPCGTCPPRIERKITKDNDTIYLTYPSITGYSVKTTCEPSVSSNISCTERISRGIKCPPDVIPDI